jgi:hypothetical protein
MTDQVQLTCRISTTNPDRPVGVEIWLDDDQIYNCEQVTETVDFAHDFADTDADHVLRFVMKNKTAEHTTIDADGTILTDSCICIDHVSFDQIKLDQMFVDQAEYKHTFNGTSDPVQDTFYGTMGCNGTVSLTFTTPVYLWLLENM